MQKKSVLILAILFASLLFAASCQKDGGSRRIGSSNATAIEGDFKTDCRVDPTRQGYYFMEVRTFSGSYFSAAYDIYGDENCKTLVMSQEQTGTFELGDSEGDATELDLVLDGVYLTLHTASLVQKYNNISYCGGGWQAGERRQITKKACANGDDTEEKDYIYDLVKQDNNTLYFGAKGSEETNGKSDSTRPVDLDRAKSYKKL